MSKVDQTVLARRYRRLLFAYPVAYRTRRADEIVGTLLDLAAPGRRRPTLAEAADLIAGGVRHRWGCSSSLRMCALAPTSVHKLVVVSRS